MTYGMRSLSEACTTGQGEAQALEALPGLAELVQPLGSLPTDAVLLTPRPETVTYNPMTRLIQPGDIYRGAVDMRSFSIATGLAAPLPGAVTVKGGDIAFMPKLAAQPDYREDVLYRPKNHQIPGAALVAEASKEFHRANELQKAAFSLLGRPTYTAIPLGASTIETVDPGDGSALPVADFMNTDGYLALTDRERAKIGLPRGMKLGQWLVGELGLQPAVYVYATLGHNIRVDTLVNGRHITTNDSGLPWAYRQYGKQVAPRFVEPFVTNFTTQGNKIPLSSDRKSTVLCTAYTTLGQAYGFDAQALLPEPGQVNDDNYPEVLRSLPEHFEAAGVPEIVLPIFTDRLTEVLALAHSQEVALSNAQLYVGGSMVARNVTYEGVVLDLDAVTPFDHRWKEAIARDYREMLDTIGFLGRMISSSEASAMAAVKQARASYAAKLAEYGVDPTRYAELTNIMDSDGVDPIFRAQHMGAY